MDLTKSVLKVWVILAAAAPSSTLFARDVDFKVFGDNYLDLDFSQNDEITAVTVSGPQIHQIFGGDVEKLKVEFLSLQCQARADDPTIQLCGGALHQGAYLLNYAGELASGVDLGEVRDAALYALTSRVRVADPAGDFDQRSFIFKFSSSLFPDIELEAKAHE